MEDLIMDGEITEIKSPIKVIPSEDYLLVIEDINGVTHYWYKAHKNEFGDFKEGEYAGFDVPVII